MKLIETKLVGRARLTMPAVHLCPYVEETDEVTVEVHYDVDNQAIELHSFAEYLRGYAEEKISHEDLAQKIATDVRRLLSPDKPELVALGVYVEFETAGVSGRIVA